MKMSKVQRLLGFAVASMALATGGTAFAELGQPAPWEVRLQEAATPVSSIETTVPPTLNRIVCKCLERDVTKRYQSMDDLLADLEGAQQGKSPSRLPSSLTNGGVGKLYWLVSIIVLVALIVTAGIVRWSLQPRTANSAHAAVKSASTLARSSTAPSTALRVASGTMTKAPKTNVNKNSVHRKRSPGNTSV